MNENLESTFSTTRQDLSNLQKTATDATKDLASTAAVHAQKAKGQIQELASHAQEEGRETLNQAKVKFSDLGSVFRDYVAERPLASLGVALALGFLVGVSRGNCRA